MLNAVRIDKQYYLTDSGADLWLIYTVDRYAENLSSDVCIGHAALDVNGLWSVRVASSRDLKGEPVHVGSFGTKGEALTALWKARKNLHWSLYQ